ncbi:hypothetical protein BWQ93_06015 [Sphingopyxis sp. QXT-31]|nr:hypothetical protein BWQ93_06015 [Sphingopyxis sp. QXT-31]
MLSFGKHTVASCASSLRQRHAEKAEEMVERQIGWSQERNAKDEVAFWTAVLEHLQEAPELLTRLSVH